MEALQPDINSLQSIVEERVDVEPPKKIAVARPLPPYWPTLSLPRAPSPTFLGDIAPALVMHAASEEEKGWHAIVKPEPSAAATPPSKRAQHGKKALKKREEWETANLVGKKCKCGKEDVEKFMLQCDDCDVWHHGCDVWYHGACVGHFAELSARQGAEAAFRRYLCPHCTERQRGGAKDAGYEIPSAGSQQAGGCTPSAKALGKQPISPTKVASAAAAVCARWSPATALASPTTALASPVATASMPSVLEPGVPGGNSFDNTYDASREVSPAGPSDVAAADGPCLLLSMLSDDCMYEVLALLPLPTLRLSVVPTAHRLAHLAEPHFQRACVKHGWRPARRTRDEPFAWRLLLRTRACAVCCGGDAHFPVRKGSGGVSGVSVLFRLCQQCARREKVQQQTLRHGYEIASIGDNGKALFARQFHMPLFGHANGFSSNLEQRVKKTGL